MSRKNDGEPLGRLPRRFTYGPQECRPAIDSHYFHDAFSTLMRFLSIGLKYFASTILLIAIKAKRDARLRADEDFRLTQKCRPFRRAFSILSLPRLTTTRYSLSLRRCLGAVGAPTWRGARG